MYNGIGLPTPRGSGTSGYVQKNLAHVRKTRQRRDQIVAQPQEERGPNFEIIAHKEKRKIEAKCLQLRDELKAEGWKKEDIDKEVDHYRQRKLRHLETDLKQKQEQQQKKASKEG